MDCDPNRAKNVDNKKNIYSSVEYAFHYADIHEISWKFSLRTSFEIE
jgi:hypothetical protein